jgi:1-aminocyclopropane-1-carboxylate deaminase/D-cysteine desulfhydrase-like pyridoxal-dependent ACC family enzyme
VRIFHDIHIHRDSISAPYTIGVYSDTPERLKRMSDRLGVALYVKRNDFTGIGLTENKVYKLEFVWRMRCISRHMLTC